MKPAGIYIHIPFCRSRCSYCDFATGMYSADAAERYVQAVVAELGSWRVLEQPGAVDTIYFGGGTPSLLSPAQLETLLSAVRQRFAVAPAAEVTMEINPGTITADTLAGFRSLGVNRASFGVQTFDDSELARLGRSHSAADARRTFHLLRDAGFADVSFDLIAGLPGQTMTGWRRNLDEAFALRPEHLSFYLLEVHQGTPLANHIKTGLQPRPDEDLAAEMYEVMLDRASESGYQHYEISNLCLPGFESRHNTKYWTTAPYYGFGCSAHSYDGEFRRWSNERDVARYVEMIEQRRTAVVGETLLSEDDRQAEAVFLGLRMMNGLSLAEFNRLFGADLRSKHEQDLTRFREAGLIECDGDLLKLTRAGALMSNEVFAAFV
ncbi:MAG TPA: radical SAM family heme chaperone HemW [Pyrinomonadaceae bacterium]|nr:radical SAM family heme chaperone HemW [Pyrinomonadaceae bacterium]